MRNLESELRQLAADGLVSDEALPPLLAVERRELMSLHQELRVAMYAGIALMAGALVTIVVRNLERIGPMAIALLLAAMGAAAWGWSWRRLQRDGELRGLQEYIALFGGLLFSADAAYIESHFHPLGEQWSLHLLILAVLHGVAAYSFRSRLLLSLSITALIGFVGVGSFEHALFNGSAEFALRAWSAAALLMLWWFVHGKVSRIDSFRSPLEHFAALLFFIGSIQLIAQDGTELAGQVALLAASILALRIARQRRRESFALYGILFELLGISVSVVKHLHNYEVLVAFYLIAAFVGAIASIFIVHSRWRLEEQ